MERRNFLKSTAGTMFAPVAVNAPELREQEELPSFEEMARLDDGKITLAAEGDGWRAICHPDITMSEGRDRGGAPFGFKTVGNPPSDDEVGSMFKERFDAKVDAVFDLIEGSDDPLQEILDLEPEDLEAETKVEEE